MPLTFSNMSGRTISAPQMLWSMNDVGWRGRIVLACSMVVYGEGRYRCDEHGVVRPPPRAQQDLAAGRFDPTCPTCGRSSYGDVIDESGTIDPRNTYAATKIHQEHLCSSFARESGVEVIALRYHNVYGSRMPRDTPYAGVASRFRSSLEADQRPRVFEDGGQRRDFVHVSDVAAANVLALAALSSVSPALQPGALRVYNVGSERSPHRLAARGGPSRGLRRPATGNHGQLPARRRPAPDRLVRAHRHGARLAG